jgi:hypothetical protein
MKMQYKLLETVVVIVAVAASLFTVSSCEPEEENNVSFYVKNSTFDTIYLHSTIKLLQNEIMPCSTIKIRESLFSTTETEYNTIYLSLYRWTTCEEYLYVYLKDSVLLKTWNKFYTDTYEKQFFRENDWEYKQYSKPNDNDYKYHDFTFEILPEDLNLK